MSLQSEIVTALAAVAGGKLYPQIAEQEATMPFVVYRITGKEPAQRLNGSAGLTRYTVLFESWAETYAAALALADQVRAAIEASSLTSFEEPASGEDYEPVTDAFVEPVVFGFWY
jgi:hypothetical protein